MLPSHLAPLDESLEDWATCAKTDCVYCGMAVRAKYFAEHVWINHGLRVDVVQVGT